MADNAEVTAIVEGFLKYLEDKKKLALLPEVVTQLSKRGYEGSKSATVISATALSPAQKKKVTQILKKRFGMQKLEFVQDESIIGGIKVMIGSRVLDLSFKSKLTQLTQ